MDETESDCSTIVLYARAMAIVLGGVALGFAWGLAEALARS